MEIFTNLAGGGGGGGGGATSPISLILTTGGTGGISLAFKLSCTITGGTKAGGGGGGLCKAGFAGLTFLGLETSWAVPMLVKAINAMAEAINRVFMCLF